MKEEEYAGEVKEIPADRELQVIGELKKDITKQENNKIIILYNVPIGRLANGKIQRIGGDKRHRSKRFIVPKGLICNKAGLGHNLLKGGAERWK